MIKYRGKKQHRLVHPKIFVWAHTKRAEIEYFQEFKNYLETPLLMPQKDICFTPQKLIEKIVTWKEENICEKDGDQVWCVFDVDDFYKNDQIGFIKAIENARNNNIKIAYINECFELWILLHFMKPTVAVQRGAEIEKKIIKEYKKNNLGQFIKNQRVFSDLLPYQSEAIKNARELLPMEYNKINWKKVLDGEGNPSTSLHFLIEEIYFLIGKNIK